MFGGDDAVIKRTIGLVFALTTIILIGAFLFGLIQLVPGRANLQQNRICTYTYTPLLKLRWLRINEPNVHISCYYASR